MEPGLYEWVVGGQRLIEQVQSGRTPLLDLCFLSITFLGDEEFYLVVLPAIYWLFDKRLGRRLLYLLVFSNLIVSLFKNTFRLPRPPEALRLIEEAGYGLPSGHATNGVSLWGYAGWRLRRLGAWVWVLVVAVVASNSFSRIYLGIHYPLDVASGLLLGMLVLFGFIWLENTVAAWLPRAERRWLIPGAACLSLILLFAHPGDEFFYPAELAVSLSALFFGATVGFLAEMEQVQFAVHGSIPRRVVRYGVGVLITLCFWLGLRVLFGLLDGPYWLVATLRYVRYALTGLAVAWWAPALFVRLGLAEREVDTLVETQTLHTIGSGAT